MEAPKNKLNPRLLKRIFSYSKPYKWLFGLSVLFTIALSALAITRPLLISKTLNEAVIEKKSTDLLNYYCLLILGLMTLEALIQFTNTNLSNILGQNIVKDLRNQIFRHILKFKNAYFDRSPVGTMVTRAISDIESLNNVFSEGFILISGDLLMLGVFVSVMLWKNWVLALLVFSTIPILLIATHFFKRGIKKTFNEVRNAVSALNTFTQERLTGMKIVQLFNKEEQELDKFKSINKQHREANIRSIFYYSVFFPIVEILSSISIALLIWFAGINYSSLNISLGDLTFFIMLTHMMFRPIRMLADRLNTLQMGIVSADRVFKVLDTQEVIKDDGAHNLDRIHESIEFKKVNFSYSENHPVLKEMSFTIKSGQTVAFVGETGSGKSTLINLLGRFYEYDEGEILIDGKNIRDYRLASLRKNTAIVLQDVFLFNDSVLNNISLYNSEITREMIEKASEEIGLKEFILSLSGGLDYQVTERGMGLSAGQRQLISFIRAYVYNPQVFVLDEATASIDTPTEILIQKAAEKLSKGRTSIIIAHRLSTIKNADKIFVLENGRIVEEGNVNELITLNGKFKSFYEAQTRHEGEIEVL